MTDARGHGKSSAPASGYRYEDLANDVIGLIDTLELSSPILVGHSMGGLTAAVVASRISKRLRALILADPTFLSPKVQREVHESDVINQHRRILDKSLDEVVTEIRTRHPHRQLDTVELIARARLQTTLAAFEVLTPPNPEFMQLVSAIDVPSLLAIGDRGNVVTLALAEELQSLNPKLQVQQIRETGHGLHYDQPEQFADAVKAFLRSLAQ
jgi:pimeloyl-ACP methyl ester carboxylesterase